MVDVFFQDNVPTSTDNAAGRAKVAELVHVGRLGSAVGGSPGAPHPPLPHLAPLAPRR